MSESQVFAEALKLASAAERAAYLERVGRDAPQLREDVEALLRAHFTDPGFLESSAAADLQTVASAPGGGFAATPTEPAAAEQPGLKLAGRYELLERIGEGGMGTVWLAQQHEPVKRQVAIKLIRAGMGSRAVLARFEA